MNISGEKLREFQSRASSMDPRDLEAFYVDAMFLIAACDLAVHRKAIGERSLIADTRLNLERYAGIMGQQECEAALFGNPVSGGDA